MIIHFVYFKSALEERTHSTHGSSLYGCMNAEEIAVPLFLTAIDN